jgi:iron complex transport system substrate-binding protein
MRGCVRPGRPIRALACALALAAHAAGAEAPPARVVSINLCTDQLALAVAAPGQLISVSRFAADPGASAMAAQAAAIPANGSGAEEVFALAPDLVLAGRFTAPATLAMLDRLGVPVAVFDEARSLADIRDRIALMGRVLGREAAAAALIADFDAGLAALAPPPGDRPRAALYGAQGYADGRATLPGDILAAAGFANVAEDSGFLPLELLVERAPEAVVSGAGRAAPSRADAILDHPVLARITGHRGPLRLRGPDWQCGTPAVLDAIARLAAAR